MDLNAGSMIFVDLTRLGVGIYQHIGSHGLELNMLDPRFRRIQRHKAQIYDMGGSHGNMQPMDP